MRCSSESWRADTSFISCSVSTLKSVILTSGRLTTSPTSAVPSKASARERRSGSLPPPSCPASPHSSTTWCPADPTTHCLSMEAAFRHQASLGALDRVLGLGRPAPYLVSHRLRTDGPNTAQRHPLRAPKTPRKRPHPQPNRDRVHDKRVTYHGDPLSHLGVFFRWRYCRNFHRCRGCRHSLVSAWSQSWSTFSRIHFHVKLPLRPSSFDRFTSTPLFSRRFFCELICT